MAIEFLFGMFTYRFGPTFGVTANEGDSTVEVFAVKEGRVAKTPSFEAEVTTGRFIEFEGLPPGQYVAVGFHHRCGEGHGERIDALRESMPPMIEALLTAMGGPNAVNQVFEATKKCPGHKGLVFTVS